jgi:uncharacterized membrane protein
MTEYLKKHSTKLLIGSVLLFSLSLFLVEYPVSDLYNHLFLPQPERVTELYFSHPASLPSTVTVGIPVTFDFRIVNHEAQTVTYSYIVTIDTPGSSTRALVTGQFTSSDGQVEEIPVKTAITRPSVRNLITVQLLGRVEKIHFWVMS